MDYSKPYKNHVHEREGIGVPLCTTIEDWVTFFTKLGEEYGRKYTQFNVTLEDTYRDYDAPSPEFVIEGYRLMTEKEIARDKAQKEKQREANRKHKEKLAASKIIDEQNEKALYEKLKEKYEK